MMKCFGCGEKRAQNYHCKIVLLDETELIHDIHDKSRGQDLLDVVFKHLNLLESAYFGLRFIEANGQPRWLDPSKRIIQQMKDVNPLTLYFGVKFYASDPCKLLEEITRYQFFLQVKQDIFQSRLPINLDLAVHLFAYSLQSELGDYEPRRHQEGYISEFRFLPNQNMDFEMKVADIHKTLIGQVPATAEMNFLERVKWLDLYGADLHCVLGEDNVEYYLGLTPAGVLVLRNKEKVGNYFWPRILKVYRKGKYFMIRVIEKNNEENTYGFETPSKSACKNLWKCCTEYQAFFKLAQNIDDPYVKGLNKGFRFSSKKRKELVKMSEGNRDRNPQFVRVPSRRYQRRLGQPDGADAPNKEETFKENGYMEVRSSIIIPPGRHITQPLIHRSTSVPSTLPVTDSPKSIKSAPWDNPRQKGLFSCPSPKSVRSAYIEYNTRSTSFDNYHQKSYHQLSQQNLQSLIYKRDSIASSSVSNHHQHNHHHHHRSNRSNRVSDNESEVSKCSKSSRHSRHSNRSTSSSHHHHRCRHRRNSSNNNNNNNHSPSAANGTNGNHNLDESGTESDSSRKRHRRRHKCNHNSSSMKMVDSEQQWKEIQRRQIEMNEKLNHVPSSLHRQAVIHSTHQRHSTGYLNNNNSMNDNSNSGAESDNSNTVKNDGLLIRSKSHSSSRDKQGAIISKYADLSNRHDNISLEIKKHIEYGLVDPTDEDKRGIRYTRVETDGKLLKIRYSPTTGKAHCKLDTNGARIHPKLTSQQYLIPGRESNTSATSSQSGSGRCNQYRDSPKIYNQSKIYSNGYKYQYQSDSNNSSNELHYQRPSVITINHQNKSSPINSMITPNSNSNSTITATTITNGNGNGYYSSKDNRIGYINDERDGHQGGSIANNYSNKYGQTNGQQHCDYYDGQVNQAIYTSPRVTFQVPPSTTTYFASEGNSSIAKPNQFETNGLPNEMRTEL